MICLPNSKESLTRVSWLARKRKFGSHEAVRCTLVTNECSHYISQVKTATETCRWWKTTCNRCFTGFRDDLCCQNSTIENKKAVKEAKLTRVLEEGTCLFIDMFSRFLKIQTVINFKNLGCINILLFFLIFCHF